MKDLTEHICVTCGAKFMAKRADAEVCSSACRQKNWRKKNEPPESISVELPKDYINVDKIALLTKDGKIEPISFHIKMLDSVSNYGYAVVKTSTGLESKEIVEPLSNEWWEALGLLTKELPKNINVSWIEPVNGEIKEVPKEQEPPNGTTVTVTINPEIPKTSKEPKETIGGNIYVPETLEALKKLCPPELKGLERSEWISKKRVEYGI